MDLQAFLANTQLWRGLPDDALAAIARIAIPQTYREGETIFWEGDEGRGFFIVVSGRVKVFKASPDGKEQILRFFEAGEHFAEVPAFDGGCFPASAAALEASRLLFFPRDAFLALLERQPRLASNVIAGFARRLREFARLIDDLSLKAVPGRLAAYLLYLSDRSGEADAVTLEMSKAQLAAFLGTIPETLSRVLKRLQQQGAIEVSGAKISILDRQALRALAGDSRRV